MSPLLLSSSSVKGLAINLAVLPTIFVLTTHMDDEELQAVEDKLQENNATLTYDIREARLVLGRVGKKQRAEFELRSRKLWTDEVHIDVSDDSHDHTNEQSPPAKRRKIDSSPVLPATDVPTDDSVTEDEDEGASLSENQKSIQMNYSNAPQTPLQTPSKSAADIVKSRFPDGTISVIKLDWLDASLAAQRLVGLKDYIVYQGKVKEKPDRTGNLTLRKSVTQPKGLSAKSLKIAGGPAHTQGNILQRAKADSNTPENMASTGSTPRKFGDRRMQTGRRGHHSASKLLLQMTTDYEGEESEIPDQPDWVKKGIKYACQRSTPPNPPNKDFIGELKQIRLARILELDEIGVRAYSTSIAAIAAYPYHITSSQEIIRLPGCDIKLANVWVEWKNTGRAQEAQKFEADESFRKLDLFYNIWGVAAKTAREFYYQRGWQDLDDVIEYGWKDLHRVQQIGVKYYEEFLKPIPRSEVEAIASVIRTHAGRVRDPGVEVVIVGGYRRGKDESGDVDVIVSHRSLEATSGLARDIVISLEKEKWITHTLIHSEHNSQRDQATLPFRASGVGGGHGFDSLDKALVVWQDPFWSTQEQDLKENPKAKNPNLHRRVDIIISPWRTVGCAVLGWSGGTTFQRDIRRYAKNVKGWKFDSSGMRDRATGQLIQSEGPNGVDGSWQDAERKVFEGLGLEYREPWERCTN